MTAGSSKVKRRFPERAENAEEHRGSPVYFALAFRVALVSVGIG